jgi:hypothetical protein
MTKSSYKSKLEAATNKFKAEDAECAAKLTRINGDIASQLRKIQGEKERGRARWRERESKGQSA